MDLEITSQYSVFDQSSSPVTPIPIESVDINSNSKQSDPEAEPVRGLELIYQVASELATRIAEEKRYEGIIKPCSVIIQRITNVSNYKIINDADKILQETNMTSDNVIIANEQPSLVAPNNQAVSTVDQPTNMHIDLSDSDDEEEMVLPSEEEFDDEILQEKTTSYFCVFCDQKAIQSRAKAVEHYQAHLDYYPYKCMICLEVLTNQQNLVKHCRAEHAETKTAIFKKKLMPWVSDWIEAFLNSQMGQRKRNFKILAYCPVCESSEKKEDIIQIPPNLIQPRKQLMHIYKHLFYEPYLCKICIKAGKKFSVSDFDDRAYEHILKNHPEAEDSLLLEVYQKLNIIKPLEGFIIHYLTSLGVSTKRRLPEKIPHFIRNKFKAKLEAKEKEKQRTIVDKDSNKIVTLGDLINQSSSTSFQNNHSNHSFNGQSILKSDKLVVSNQVKTNPHSLLNTPSTKAAIASNKNVTFLSPPNMMIYSSPQVITTQNNISTVPVQNCITTTEFNTNLPTLTNNGSVFNNQQSMFISKSQPPSVIRLPCGQIMVRNSIPNSFVNLNRSTNLLKISPRPSSFSLTLNASKLPQKVHASSSTTIHHQELDSPVKIQILPDVETIADVSIAKQKNGEFVKGKYLCIFCKDSINFETYVDAIFHFSRHLNYTPVTCLLCYRKFEDLNAVNQHFDDDHPHHRACDDGVSCPNLIYYLNQEAETEKWIEENLSYQIRGEMIRSIDPDLAKYCPVCCSILNTMPLHDKPHVPQIDVVRSHINNHLNYKPFECYLCNHGPSSVSVRFHSVGEAALKHLRDHHDYAPYLADMVKEFFLFKPIPGLENFIKSFLISDYYTVANQSMEQRDGRQSLPLAFPVIRPQISSISAAYSRPNDLAKRCPNVVPRPPEAPSPSQHKQYKNILVCYHCKSFSSGPQELLSHSKSAHPNQSIAAYALPPSNGY